MPVGLICLRNMIVRNFQLHSFHVHFWTPNVNGILQNQQAYGIYYVMMKWNYYLQGFDIVVCNDHKPLQKFLSGKNAKNKVNRWCLDLQLIISTSNGYQVPTTRQLTVIHDW